MQVIQVVGRIFLSTIFLIEGINKILNYESTIEYMENFSVPEYLAIPAIIVEIFEHVFKILDLVRIVAFESRIIRIGFFFLILCTDKSGSSILTVFFPIRIASTLLLSL